MSEVEVREAPASPERPPEAPVPEPATAAVAAGERPAAAGTAEPLRIAMVAPPWYEIPPGRYGGIESMCGWLVDRLVARGHEVTLLAAGRDLTSARFRQVFDEPPTARIGETLPEVLHAAAVHHELAGLGVQLVHDHSFVGSLLAGSRATPTVVTAHGPVDNEFGSYYRVLGEMASLVAISDAQRALAPDIPWAARVHNGIPVDDYPWRADKDDYVLFLGRMNPDKGAELAIDAAEAAGRRIVLAAKCTEPDEQAYFDSVIRPRLGPRVEWFGEAGPAAKKDLLSRARCLLFPVRWEEPFGIVMVEAMACGTPVVALRRGAVPEVVGDGAGGIVCTDPAELPPAIERAGELDPTACRDWAAARFDVGVMTDGYEAAYRAVLAGEAGPRARTAAPAADGTPASGRTPVPGPASAEAGPDVAAAHRRD